MLFIIYIRNSHFILVPNASVFDHGRQANTYCVLRFEYICPRPGFKLSLFFCNTLLKLDKRSLEIYFMICLRILVGLASKQITTHGKALSEDRYISRELNLFLGITC